MHTYYREPQIEASTQAITLQNRCGLRLSLLVDETHTALEFAYKPNAMRRKDYRARNFSNRDVLTTLLRTCLLPELRAQDITAFDYDPFCTQIATKTNSHAANHISVINIADENCFAITAQAPLLLAVQPQYAFVVEDGLLLEVFHDRGEQIVTFVAFSGMEDNRYRVTDDGLHVLQMFGDECVLIGGEETVAQARRVVHALRGQGAAALRAHTERVVAPALAKGRVQMAADTDLQRVLDLNRRLVYAGLDEGGACFGALNRIYHLIWTRDGSMTAAHYARAGNPDFLRIWAPFLLANPVAQQQDGARVPVFTQILGSRWSKAEEDGMFYAMLTLFTHVQTTGDDALLHGPAFPTALAALDAYLARTWHANCGMIITDTFGETPLASNPYFGYDMVNGTQCMFHGDVVTATRTVARVCTLYNMVNTWNILCMAGVLLSQRRDLAGDRDARYAQIAAALVATLRARFIGNDGLLWSAWHEYTDQSEEWIDAAHGDYWEYAWALALGPYFPLPQEQLASARRYVVQWPSIREYGYCPWNVLARQLREYGMTDAAWRAMLADELHDALLPTRKYPLAGALTEYRHQAEGWRGVPFSAGSLTLASAGLLLQSLPLGIAARASDLVARIDDFVYRTARLTVTAEGTGAQVAAVVLNGQALDGTLQLPHARLRCGANTLVIQRGAAPAQPRLYSSTAELLDVRRDAAGTTYDCHNPIPSEFLFESCAAAALSASTPAGEPLPVACEPLADTELLLARVPSHGALRVVLRA